MKKELFTAIILAIIGVFSGCLITNLFIGGIDSTTVKTVAGDVSSSYPDPNPEVFNYRALNPTVEVYVGNCSNYGSNGICADEAASVEIVNLETEGSSSNSSNNSGSSSNTNSSTQSTTNGSNQSSNSGVKQENF